MDELRILLVGAGPMAVEYARVLSAQNVKFDIVGRGPESAEKFKKEIGKEVFLGGLEHYVKKNDSIDEKFTHAIIVTNERELGNAARLLLTHGIKNILIEKPGGFNVEDIENVSKLSKSKNADVFVGYNRRFYQSVLKAKQIIEEEGGLTSFCFEFTEWGHMIKDLVKAPGVKENWFLHNSTHIVDLAFHIGGFPKEMANLISGKVDWHPTASIFAGAGISIKNALFSYQANWEAPGRWSVEFMTRKSRLIFRPIEKLHIQKIGSVAIDLVEMDYNLDTNFKPGLYKQTEAFISKDYSQFVSIHEQLKNVENYYLKMLSNGENNV